MKNIKNIIAIAVAAAIMSPMSAMANTVPDNVGNVTYMGNIVANSPMWQWTVNDYPGPRLDAKPSEATTADGVTTYKLAGQPFIAVSGYLPSTTGMVGPASTSLGTSDITELRDGNGNPIADIQALAEPQAMSFTISAVATDARGVQVEGKLRLNATEIRGVRYQFENGRGTAKVVGVVTGNTTYIPVAGGSCFVGSSGPVLTISGNADNPQITNGSATAAAAWLRALASADSQGAVRFSTLTGSIVNSASSNPVDCSRPSTAGAYTVSATAQMNYISAAHTVEITPTDLVFNTPVQGAWNATLNVTAYQM